MKKSGFANTANGRSSIWSAVFFLLLFGGILWLSWIVSENRTETTFEQGRKFLRVDDWGGAMRCFTRVIKMDPEFSPGYVDRAMAERGLCQYNKAISDCNRAIEINSNDCYAFIQRGLTEIGEGNVGAAIADYVQLHAPRLKPTNSYAFYEMGILDCELSNYDEAIVSMTHGIQLGNDPSFGYFHRAIVKEKDGNMDGALSDFDKAIDLSPTNSVYYNDRGWAEFLKSDFGSSIADATRSIQLDPNFGYAYGTRGWARYKMGDLSGAVEDCKKATQLFKPGSTSFLHDQGMLDFIAKDYAQAIADWQNAIRREPDLKKELLPWIEKAQKIGGIKLPNSSNNASQSVTMPDR
ncbi:MAG: tetratricopeptide repeat protein [Limisphaerales bacterium]